MDGATTWERLRRVDPLVWNGLLALCLFLIQGLPLVMPPGGDEPALPGYTVPLLLLGSAPIMLRRRWPLIVLAVVAAAAGTSSLLGHPQSLVPSLVVAIGSAAAWLDRDRVLRAVVPIGLVPVVLVTTGDPQTDNWVEIAIGIAVTLGVPLLIGRVLFNRRARIERDRERAASDAVAAERARIARELHDVVAHAVSVMVVQAGAARTVVERDPEAARHALRQIESTGRTGLVELRRLLGILKADADPAELEPQPGLDRLDDLLATVRAAGLPVETTTEGTPRRLAPGADLTAYRLIQEALTNVMKHAGDAHANVALRYGDEHLEIEVADDGRGPMPDQGGGMGHGLIGMRERIALFGGSLETGARTGGGFVVRARIPVEAT